MVLQAEPPAARASWSALSVLTVSCSSFNTRRPARCEFGTLRTIVFFIAASPVQQCGLPSDFENTGKPATQDFWDFWGLLFRDFRDFRDFWELAPR